MNVLAGLAVVAAYALAAWLVLPAARRTGFGTWHPAMVWLALEAVFFGGGSIILAISEGRAGPAWDTAAWALVFGFAVWGSDQVAARRSAEQATDGASDGATTVSAAGIRWSLVAAMLAVGLLALVPTLIEVGIPALVADVTGARSAIGGLDLQVLRVALPAGLVAATVAATITPSARLRVAIAVALVVAIAAELALASRYLAAELIAVVVIGLALARRPLAGRVLIGVGVVAVGLFVVVGVVRAYEQAGEDPVRFALDRTVNRVLLVQPRTLDAIQTAIPSEVPYFGGLTWIRRLAPLLGRDDVPNLGYWIYPRLFPDQPTAGYAAPGVVGEAWANFGPVGVLVAAGLGVLAERLGALVALRRSWVVDIAAGAVAFLFLARTHALGLTGLAVLAVLVAAWRLVAAPASGLGADLLRMISWRAATR